MTFQEVGQVPYLLQLQNTGRPEMAESGDVFGHYLMKKRRLYPFGYGLVILNLSIRT
jgi:hypothetical protein